jgi:hypothetical protein
VGKLKIMTRADREVATVNALTELVDRPSLRTSVCTPVSGYAVTAHAVVVGVPAVTGATTVLIQRKSLQVVRTQAQWSPDLADQGSNGFAAKANGMGTSPALGVKVRGVPPRGKPKPV